MSAPRITIDNTPDGPVFRLSGRFVTDALTPVEEVFSKLGVVGGRASLDLSETEALDTAGAWLIADLRMRLAEHGTTLEITGASAARERLIEKVGRAAESDRAPEARAPGMADRVAAVGAAVVRSFSSVKSLLNFLGLVMARLGRTLVSPSRLRAAALFSQMKQSGYDAVPIVALMGFLIGVVLAYQGAAQLRQFGAEIFVVEFISISVLRELGILLTAIIVAGRSGSAFAAAIGSMKVNEEVDAMRTLGLDPVEVLVLPRAIALVVMLPVLGFIANIAALLGGALMSWIELGVSPDVFTTRLRSNTDVWHLGVGMIKAPFFAFTIALVSCWQGFQVKGSADSVGEKTRSSVVQSIFLVIVLDAVFSIFFSEIGV